MYNIRSFTGLRWCSDVALVRCNHLSAFSHRFASTARPRIRNGRQCRMEFLCAWSAVGGIGGSEFILVLFGA